MTRCRRFLSVAALACLLEGLLVWPLTGAEALNHPTNDYAAVEVILNRHCLDCHAATDPEGQLVLESFEAMRKGGESGPALVPGKSAESLLVQMIEGRSEKDGKK